jgi:hypothetical protein
MVATRAAARDRRWVAVHEAGHVIAARHFGAEGFGMIWREGDRWKGCADIPTIDAMPADQRRVIGLAGAAALMTWLGIPADRFFSINVGVSTNDWELIGCAAGRPDRRTHSAALGETLTLLAHERKALLTTAGQLIVESRNEKAASKGGLCRT